MHVIAISRSGVGAFLLLLTLYCGCFSAAERHLWQEVEAPGGILHITYTDPPAFGSHTLYFSYVPEGTSEAQDLGTRELNNDGANLGPHNLEIPYRGTTGMRIVLLGQQQEPQGMTLMISDNTAELIDDEDRSGQDQPPH